MSKEFTEELKVNINDKEIIRKQREEIAIEDALTEKKNGNKDSITDIVSMKSRDEFNLYSILDDNRRELLDRIGNALQEGKISEKHYNYFSSYKKLSQFMDKYLKRLEDIINSEPSGEIIIAPEIDSEMEIIMKELEEEKENIK